MRRQDYVSSHKPKPKFCLIQGPMSITGSENYTNLEEEKSL